MHGVLDNQPDKVIKIINKLSIQNDIYVISGSPYIEIVEQLINLGYDTTKFTKILSVVGWLRENDAKLWKDYKDTWWASDKDWWTSKGKICEKYNIDMLIDDRKKYNTNLPTYTKFIYVDEEKKKRLDSFWKDVMIDIDRENIKRRKNMDGVKVKPDVQEEVKEKPNKIQTILKEITSKYSEEDVNSKLDEQILEYVGDDWEEDFDDIYDCYIEQGRGEAESDILNLLMDPYQSELNEEEFEELQDLILEEYPALDV